VSALERIGEETGNPGYLREVRARKGETVASVFKRPCPAYLPTERNYERIVETLAFNALSAAQQQGTVEEMTDDLISSGAWTVGNLVVCYHALSAEGLLDVPLGRVRNLSTAERLRVTRLAQSGRVDEAIGEHLRCALDGEEPGMEILNDPNYRQACDNAVWDVFADLTNDYAPTPEREAYMQRHCAGRPVTLALLESAWSACQRNEASYARHEILNQVSSEAEPPTERELNGLSDAAVNDLYRASLREYVKSIHATK
jgi:hypothetical protein